MQRDIKKDMILKALAQVVISLRANKSQFILASENDISVSIISTIERGLKDPQLTTVFRLAEALNVEPGELMNLIKQKLPKDFSMIEK